MKMPTARKVSESETLMTHRALPEDANPAGNVHGGVRLKHLDLAGAVCAMRPARMSVVTASIDRMEFKAAVKVGELMLLHASVNRTGKQSMEIGVRVVVEDLMTGEQRHAASAYLTFVAMGADKKPASVPDLILETPTHERRNREANMRRELRLEERKRERLAQELEQREPDKD